MRPWRVGRRTLIVGGTPVNIGDDRQGHAPRTRMRRGWLGSLLFATVALFGASFHPARVSEPGQIKLELIKTIRLPDHPSFSKTLGSLPWGLAWSPDGGRLAVMYGYGNDVGVWRITGEFVTQFTRHEGQGPGGDCLAFLPGGKSILAPAPTDTEQSKKYAFGLWNANTGELERLVPGPFPSTPPPPGHLLNAVGMCALSADGRYVAMTSRQMSDAYGFAIYDALNWKVVDVRRVTGGDLPLRWGGEPDTYLHGVEWPSSLAFGAADTLSVGFVSYIMSLAPPYSGATPTFIYGTNDWDLQPLGPAVKMLNGPPSDEGVFEPIAYRPDGALLAIGVDTIDAPYKTALKTTDPTILRKLAHLKIWDVEAQKVVAAYLDADFVNAIDWSPDGKLLAVAADAYLGQASFLDIYGPPRDDGRPLLRIILAEKTPFVRFSPDGTALAITQGNAVQIYRLTTR